MKLYALVLALSFASDANANRIRGTTNSSHTTHYGQQQQDNSNNSQYQSQEEELNVVSRCLSYEDAEEEDDDITNMNIALCEDYFSLQCNTAFTNDCSTLLLLSLCIK